MTATNPETDQPTDEQIRERAEKRYTWFGYLADENVEHIAQRTRNLLGGRGYTFVANNVVHIHSHPEVRTSQRLSPHSKAPDGVSTHRIGDPGPMSDGSPWTTCGISVSDSYGVWGMHADVPTEREAHAIERAAREGGEGSEAFRRWQGLTYVTIEGGREPDDVGRWSSIKVRFHNAMSPRELLHWVIVPEMGGE